GAEQPIGLGGLAVGGECLRAQRQAARRQWLRRGCVQRDQRVGRPVFLERQFGQRDRAQRGVALVDRGELGARRGMVAARDRRARRRQPCPCGDLLFRGGLGQQLLDRKSTRLNSSHVKIS